MLLLFYPPYRAASQEELMQQCIQGLGIYLRELANYSSEQLKAGWRDVVKAHKTERWPTIAQITNACDNALSGSGRISNSTRQRALETCQRQFGWNDSRQWILDLVEKTNLEIMKIRCWFSPCILQDKTLICPSFVAAYLRDNGSYMLDAFQSAHGFRPEVVIEGAAVVVARELA